MAILKKAPSFRLSDKSGALISLKDFEQDYLVVYFYPKDSTPGCTIEAQEFNGLLGQFRKRGIGIIGISGGDEHSKSKFCKAHRLRFPLLSDKDFSVSRRYGVYGTKKFMGRSFKGIRRTTFVLDKRRRIVKTFKNVKALGHAQEVLEWINALREL